MNGRAKAAAQYADVMCKAMCRGPKHQKVRDQKPHTRRLVDMVENDMQTIEINRNEEDDQCSDLSKVEYEAFDDVKGGPLPIDKVKAVSADAMRYVHERKVCKYSALAECSPVFGKKAL